jgi:hypothetical protein
VNLHRAVKALNGRHVVWHAEMANDSGVMRSGPTLSRLIITF